MIRQALNCHWITLSASQEPTLDNSDKYQFPSCDTQLADNNIDDRGIQLQDNPTKSHSVEVPTFDNDLCKPLAGAKQNHRLGGLHECFVLPRPQLKSLPGYLSIKSAVPGNWNLHKMKATLPATSVLDMLLEIWNHTFAYKFLLSLYSLFGDSLVSLLWPTCITYYPPYQLKHLRPLFLPLLHPLLHRDDDRVRFVVRSVLWALFSGSCEQQFQTFKRFSELCCFNSMVDKI